jgi:CubicO group peptidase (beta-lactamase class C family)
MSVLLASLVLGLANPVDRAIDKFIETKQSPGVVVLVKRDGKLVYERAAGYANLETETPMSMDSVHELASVSKQFTAAATMRLVESGKLKLTDSLSSFVEGAPDSWKEITIEHLLHHTSGLPDYLEGEVDLGKMTTDQFLIESLRDKPLVFAPGEKWEYSNSGYMALGYIVGKVSGSKFGNYVSKELFEPAGMKSAVITNPLVVLPKRAYGYTKFGKEFRNEALCSPGYSALGDGMVMASARDLVAWHDSMRAGKILGKKSWEYLWTPSAQSIKNEAPYGGGFGIERAGERPTVSHSGGWLGTMTFFISDFASDSCMVILVNCDSADPLPLLAALREQFPEID